MSGDAGPLVVVDTNVLLAATDQTRNHHTKATRFLQLDERTLALTPQIVREYLAVATRPLDANGLSLPVRDAATNVREFLSVLKLLTEGPTATARLLDFITLGPALGKQVHDANVVAVALSHDAVAIVTDNTRHFDRFASLIAVEDLAEGAF